MRRKEWCKLIETAEYMEELWREYRRQSNIAHHAGYGMRSTKYATMSKAFFAAKESIWAAILARPSDESND